MLHSLIPTAVTLTAALVTGVTEPRPQDSQTRIYPLHGLMIGQDKGIYLSVLPRAESRMDGEVTDRNDLGRIPAGDLQDIFFELYDELPGLKDTDAFVGLRGTDEMIARGPQTWHAQLSKLLSEADRIVGHRSRLELTLIRGDAGAFDALPSGATLPAATVQSLLANDGVDGERQTLILDLRPGSTGFIDNSSGFSVVSDYDVEIASGAGVLDPQVSMMRSGTRVAARFVPATDGGRLRLIYDRSERLGSPKLARMELATFVASSGKDGDSRQLDVDVVIEQQEMLTRGVALDLDLPSDQVAVSRLAWNLGDASGSEVLLARVVSEPLAPVQVVEVGGGALLFLNREAVEPGYVYAQRPDSSWIQTMSNTRSRNFELWLSQPGSSLEFELLPRINGRWRTAGPWIFTGFPDAASARAAAADIQPLLREASESIGLRATSTDRDGARAVTADLPVPLDGQGFGFAVRSTPRVADLDVEVATNSLIGDPSVVEMEAGLAVGLVARRARSASADYTIGVRGEVVSGTTQDGLAELPKVPGGVLSTLDVDVLRVDQLVDLGQSLVRVGDSGVALDVQLR